MDSNGLPLLDQFSKEGFVDCVLKIVSVKQTPTHHLLSLRASRNGQPVGLEVGLLEGMKAGFDADMNLVRAHVYRNGVVFRSAGEESDHLLTILAALYGQENEQRRMVASETFTAIALHQGEVDLTSELVKIKIFGRDADPLDEDEYNETFFNLDLADGFVYWNEKDQEYRKPLIKALSQ